MDSRQNKAIEAVLEQLIEHGPEGIATVFARTRFERSQSALIHSCSRCSDELPGGRVDAVERGPNI